MVLLIVALFFCFLSESMEKVKICLGNTLQIPTPHCCFFHLEGKCFINFWGFVAILLGAGVLKSCRLNCPSQNLIKWWKINSLQNFAVTSRNEAHRVEEKDTCLTQGHLCESEHNGTVQKLNLHTQLKYWILKWVENCTARNDCLHDVDSSSQTFGVFCSLAYQNNYNGPLNV